MAIEHSARRATRTALCPRCQQAMTATARAAKRQAYTITGHDADNAAQLTLPVWRCELCGIDRARFE